MPPPKPSVILSPRAQDDRDDIYRRGVETWGREQADDYLEGLFRAFATLTEFPQSGMERDDVRPGLRSRLVGKHVVYYRIGRDGRRISRILHERQDPFAAAGM